VAIKDDSIKKRFQREKSKKNCFKRIDGHCSGSPDSRAARPGNSSHALPYGRYRYVYRSEPYSMVIGRIYTYV
jgi:hypothetical protein